MFSTRWMPGALAALTLLAACDSSNNDNYYPPNPGPQTRLQVLHAVADAPPVQVLVDGVVALSSLDYGQGTAVQVFTPGSHTIEVQALTPGTPTTVIGPTTMTLAQDTDYVVVADGTVGSISAQTYPHDLTTVPAGSTKVQVLHSAPSAPSVDVYVTAPGAALSSSQPLGTIAYQGAIGPSIVPSGQYEIRVTPAGDPATVVFDSGPTTFPDGADLVIAAVTNTGPGSAPIRLAVFDAFGNNERLVDASTPAEVRVVHASPNAPAIAVVANGNTAAPLVPTLSFPDFTPYFSVTPGSYALAIAPASNPAGTLLTVSHDFNAGTVHSVYAIGTTSALSSLVTWDDNRRYATQARLRIVHAAPSAGLVDVYLTAHGAGIASAVPTYAAVPFGVDSELDSYAAGSYDVTITTAGSKTVLLGPANVTLANKGLYTAVARDAPGGGAPLGLILLDDFAP